MTGGAVNAGVVDEAYERYGVRANRGGTYLATFRAVAKKYPHKAAGDILVDLVKTMPGEEGKWFAARPSSSSSRTPILALRVASHAYVLQTGRVVAAGATTELRENPMVRRAYLGQQG